MIEILLAIIGTLMIFLGIEKSRGSKKDKKIQEQDQKIEQGKKQEEILQVAIEVPQKISQEEDRIEEDQDIRDQTIQEAETDEEVLEVAQDIVDLFNDRPGR